MTRMTRTAFVLQICKIICGLYTIMGGFSTTFSYAQYCKGNECSRKRDYVTGFLFALGSFFFYYGCAMCFVGGVVLFDGARKIVNYFDEKNQHIDRDIIDSDPKEVNYTREPDPNLTIIETKNGADSVDFNSSGALSKHLHRD